ACLLPSSHPSWTALTHRLGCGGGRGPWLQQWPGCVGSAEVEDDPSLDAALLDLLEALVDLVEPAGLADHPGPALRVDRVDLGEVLAGAHDGPADGDAVQDGLEDRQADAVVRGQGDEDQRAAPAKRPEGLLEGLGRDGNG